MLDAGTMLESVTPASALTLPVSWSTSGKEVNVPTVKRCAHCGKEFARMFSRQRFCCDNCRFWAKVDKNGPVPAHRPELGPCWVWTSALNEYRGGYGMFGMPPGRVLPTHRYALEMALGRPIRIDMQACHHCDNPPCVNPGHLFEATNRDNHIDMVSKGRALIGERGPSGKLTESDAREILRRYADGELVVTIAARFGVCSPTVSSIARGRTWKHLAVPGMRERHAEARNRRGLAWKRAPMAS